MGIDRIRIKRQRLVYLVYRRNEIPLTESEPCRCKMKTDFIAGVQTTQALFGVIKFALIARGIHQDKHRFVVSWRSIEDGDRLLSRLGELSHGHEDERQFRAGFDIVGSQFPCGQEKGTGVQRSTLFVPDDAQFPDGGYIPRIFPQQVQIFDLRLVILARLEIAVGSLQKTRLFPFRRTASGRATNQNGRNSARKRAVSEITYSYYYEDGRRVCWKGGGSGEKRSDVRDQTSDVRKLQSRSPTSDF